MTIELSALEHLKNIVSQGLLRNFYSDLLILADNWHNILSVRKKYIARDHRMSSLDKPLDAKR